MADTPDAQARVAKMPEENAMNDFANDLVQIIQNSILNQARKAEFIDTGFGGTKLKLPPEFLLECYRRINMDVLQNRIVERLEREVADKVVNKMVTEFSNDVKQIMSNVELREELRGILRDRIKVTKALLEESDHD